MHNRQLISLESVTEGHPDKICDQISDAVFDAIIDKERQLESSGYIDQETGEHASVANVRCACECYATTGHVAIGGEIMAS